MDNKAGIRCLLDFWQDHYLNEYISEGGSKIKFITGREGSGKTFLLSEFQKDAERCGYLTVSLSAEQFYLNDFSFIYSFALISFSRSIILLVQKLYEGERPGAVRKDKRWEPVFRVERMQS